VESGRARMGGETESIWLVQVGGGMSRNQSHQPRPAMRHTIRRAWCGMRPAVLKIRNRSRLGRAVRYCCGSAMRFSAVIPLCASTAKRNQAALAPKRQHEAFAVRCRQFYKMSLTSPEASDLINGLSVMCR